MDDRGLIVLNRFFEGLDELEKWIRVDAQQEVLDAKHTMALYGVAGIALVFGAFGYRIPRAFLSIHMAFIGMVLSPYWIAGNAALVSVPNVAVGVALGAMAARWPKFGIVMLATIAVNRNVYTTWTLPIMARLGVFSVLTFIIGKAVSEDSHITMYILMLSAIQAAVVLTELLPFFFGIAAPPTKLIAGVLIFVQHYQRVMESTELNTDKKKED